MSLITAITTFATAVHVTISELRLETFLPADSRTAKALECNTREVVRRSSSTDSCRLGPPDRL
ncbi:hypothetical protein [Nocardia donostiensis]|uniref:hypothetical protein n=1 Tax=Nocardia donostiensis TaxID=1538463 RepID=UPI001C3784C5|nr:hypothetical protein [Nocardia donostiensis]